MSAVGSASTAMQWLTSPTTLHASPTSGRPITARAPTPRTTTSRTMHTLSLPRTRFLSHAPEGHAPPRDFGCEVDLARGVSELGQAVTSGSTL